jgi:hypothetical protein
LTNKFDTFLKNNAPKPLVVREDSNLRTIALILSVFVLFVLIPSVSAQVLVFDEYTTQATINKDHIHVERTVTLKNNGQAPIIPGELHFRFFERDGDDKIPIPVTNALATSNRGESLNVKVLDRGTETDLSVQVWNPLLPGFTYQFTMEYDIQFTPRGILFHELTLPQEQTTVPILREDVTFLLDDKYYVTYAPQTSVNKLSGNVVVEWDEDAEDRTIEYSRLPFPQIGIRAVNAFWLTLIVALLAMLAISAKKQQKQQPPRNNGSYQYQQYQSQQPPYGGRQ